LADGEERFAVRSRRELLPHVEWAINWQLAACQARRLAIHSAVMAREGEALILAAPPGHGKSTLAAALLARGWSYMSDEFALIEPETLDVVAYPKALCIKQGSYQAVLRMGMPLETDRDHRKGKKGRVSFLDPLEVRPDAVAERARVRMVLFPRYEEGQRAGVHRMSAARGVFELTQLAFNFRRFRGMGLSLVSRLMQGCCVGRLDAGESWKTCSVIERAWANRDGQSSRRG
jgi:HprK-related kinase A